MVKLTPFLGSTAYLCACLCAVIALPTQFWSTSFDGTGSHISLWQLCWPVGVPGVGAVLHCEQLNWENFVSSFQAEGMKKHAMTADEAASKWGLLLSSRYCLIAAAVFYLLASGMQAIAAVGYGSGRLLLISSCTLALVGTVLNYVAVGCFAYLVGKWSAYDYTLLIIGPSWLTALSGACIALITSCTLIVAGVVMGCCVGGKGAGASGLPKYAGTRAANPF